jgi:hypothetical protein
MRFNRFYVVGVVALFLAGLAVILPVRKHVLGASVPHWATPQAEVLSEYCISCHDQAEKKGGLALDTVDFNRLSQDAAVWEKVIRKVRTGMMPPADEPRPREAVLDAFAAGLEQRLDRIADEAPNPGAPALHRLNRTEYTNVIRDLLAVEVDAETLLPGDDSAEGFDNIADVLGVSPSLIEGYVSAAMKISRLAVGDRSMIASRHEYRAEPGLAQDSHIEGLPLGTRGGMLVRHTFPLDAEYEFSISAGAGPGQGLGGLGNRSAAPDVVLTFDGVPVPVQNARSFKIPVKAGTQTIGIALADKQRATGVDDVFSTFVASGGVQSIVITGPFNPSGPGQTASRERIFVCQPATATEELPCAKKILAGLATRAFRHPVAESHPSMQTLLGFYAKGRGEGDFETGIEQGLARILVDPRFLFRIEEEPADLKPGSSYRINDFDLASRLSFFLWSSIPDDELLQVAAKGRLSDPNVLDRQIRRMLVDPRAEALVRNFAGQWLHLRELGNVDPESKDFDANLRHSFLRETEMLFDTVVRDDRSVMELLNANYTFVDERLARHYGIPGVSGSYIRRVALPEDSPRRGVLGHGSVLTVTSVANRTSPVGRGVWILENILGAPPPKPPPGVETNLDAVPGETKFATLRDRLEQHRTDPVCASCHKIMDPIGFALENFDLVGKWRDTESGAPIDASGVLVDGTKLDGPVSLRTALLSRPDAFVTTLTEKLLTYALGRGLQPYDMPTVRSIVAHAEEDEYRFSTLVLGIVRSTPFQMKLKRSTQAATAETQVAAR